VDHLANFMQGLGAILSPYALMAALIGTLIGFLAGALPGMTATAAIAIALPLTFGMDPIIGIVVLTSIYYAASFGGAVPAILVNTPGDNPAVISALEGYPLTQQGLAISTMRVAFISSFVGGTVGLGFVVFLAPALAELALNFGPPEYFLIMVLGISSVLAVSSGSIVKGLISALLGAIVGLVGMNPLHGAVRMTFGYYQLLEGVPFVVLALALFCIAVSIVNLDHRGARQIRVRNIRAVRNWPDREEMRLMAPAWTRGTVTGFVIGVLPGAGPTIASFLAYSVTKMTASEARQAKFGNGAVEGVAAAESANNAATSGSLVPMLSLGIPGSAGTAVLLGALLMFGLRPGPMLFTNHTEIAFAVLASVLIGTFFMLLVGLILPPLFSHILRVPDSVLFPVILVVAVAGTYSVNNDIFPVYLLWILGIVGYLMMKFAVPAPPAILAAVLMPLMEVSFMQSLTMSRGSLNIFIDRPVSLALLVICVLFLILPPLLMRRRRAKA